MKILFIIIVLGFSLAGYAKVETVAKCYDRKNGALTVELYFEGENVTRRDWTIEMNDRLDEIDGFPVPNRPKEIHNARILTEAKTVTCSRNFTEITIKKGYCSDMNDDYKIFLPFGLPCISDDKSINLQINENAGFFAKELSCLSIKEQHYLAQLNITGKSTRFLDCKFLDK